MADTTDDDLIRRGDALEAVTDTSVKWGFTGEPAILIDTKAAIRALPAQVQPAPVALTIKPDLSEVRSMLDSAEKQWKHLDHIAATIRVNAMRHGATDAEIEAFIKGEADFVEWLSAQVAPQPAPVAMGWPYEFDRYIDGQLMAEGVTIARQCDLPAACREAARIASKGPNGDVSVLVLSALDARPVAEVQAEAVAGAYAAEVDVLARAMSPYTLDEWEDIAERFPGPVNMWRDKARAIFVEIAPMIMTGAYLAAVDAIDQDGDFVKAIGLSDRILALTPADAAAAMDRIRAEARAPLEAQIAALTIKLAAVEALVERAFKDGMSYANNVNVLDPAERQKAWEWSQVRADLAKIGGGNG